MLLLILASFFLSTLFIIVVILQHGDMTVTSEEKVLDAILTWCMEGSETCHWNSVDKLLSTSTPEQLFGERLTTINDLLPLVRFPLMQLSLLQRVLPSVVLSYHGAVFTYH
jgi:hypothetical protein